MVETLNVLKGHRHTYAPYLTGRTPRCQGSVNKNTGLARIGGETQCEIKGSFLEPARRGEGEEGKLYYFCGHHAPSKIKAKTADREADRAAAREAGRVYRLRDVRIPDEITADMLEEAAGMDYGSPVADWLLALAMRLTAKT